MFLNFIPLRERRPRSVPLLPTLMLFQFTPLRKGQQYLRHPEHDPEHISIHAPTQGATWMNDRDAKKNKFQFTPLRKGRPFPPARRTSPINFNSRPYARGDVQVLLNLVCTLISIHAPTQGATRCGLVRSCAQVISIHAPTQGATVAHSARWKMLSTFQFTPLRKGRQQKICVFSRSFVQPLQIIVL